MPRPGFCVLRSIQSLPDKQAQNFSKFLTLSYRVMPIESPRDLACPGPELLPLAGTIEFLLCIA